MTGTDFRMSLHGLPYDQTIAAQPPIKIKSASSAAKDGVPPLPTSLVHREVTSATGAPPSTTGTNDGAVKQTNGGRGQDSTLGNDYGSFDFFSTESDHQPRPGPISIPGVPQIRVDDDATIRWSEEKEPGDNTTRSMKPSGTSNTNVPVQNAGSKDAFQGLTLDLPSGALGDELQAKKMQFSNRGSMLLDGRKVSNSPGSSGGDSLQVRPTTVQRIPTSSSVPDRLPPRMVSTDEEMLSERVRSFYAMGSDVDAESQSQMASRMNQRWQDSAMSERNSVLTSSRRTSITDPPVPLSPSLRNADSPAIVREANELAGGLEDWQDVDNAAVDRYGFIIQPNPTYGVEQLKVKRSPTSSGNGLQRVSTSLQLASEAPRRRHTVRRAPSSAHGERTTLTRKNSTVSSKSAGSPARPSSARSATVHRHSTLRAASNRLPGNRDRRLMDEAADMLTLPRSLSSSSQTLSRTATAGSDHSTNSQSIASKMTSAAARRKETEREEKWRKMAKPISAAAPLTANSVDSSHHHSAGNKTRDFESIGTTLLFSFPSLTDSKLVSRTWKGIPDSWRAQAWHYFLSVSAAKHPGSLPDDKLIKLFYAYQEQNSTDDVQIDIDVPRTISSHIMFRRRYRGGQRLLFRVLHAMSLYAPETGYVQGMATLAATLLAYYEEEKAFVILVRLWDVRGLGRLYESGFGGLMEALDQFEQGWLGEGEVGKKLNSLHIVPTAYGTKWYLTLFNYSIPFPAQLRVWDVFMLLGDDAQSLALGTRPAFTQPQSQLPPQPASSSQQPQHKDQPSKHPPLGSTLDVLHATSAALIDGMRDILLASDFENSMKVLTSWIPIRDEDIFMRVAKAEWKMHNHSSTAGST